MTKVMDLTLATISSTWKMISCYIKFTLMGIRPTH